MNNVRTLAGVAVIAAIILITGCPNTMSGTVDNETVGPARDAIFDISTVDIFGVEAAFITIVITGVPNACEVWDDFDDVDWSGDCDDYCEDLNAVATEHLIYDTYWNLTISLHAEDDNSVEADYDQDDDFGEDEFHASIENWDVSLLYDVDACEEECEDGDPVIDHSDDENAKSGTVIVSRYEHKDVIKGNYEIEFDSEDEVVKGQFKATHCDLWTENYLW